MTQPRTNPLKRIAAFVLVLVLAAGSIPMPVLAAYDDNTHNIYIAQDEYEPADAYDGGQNDTESIYESDTDSGYDYDTNSDDTTNYTPPPVYSRGTTGIRLFAR